MPDYSKLSDSDLMALKENRYSDISNEGLLSLKGGEQQSLPQKQYTPTQQYMANLVQGVPFGTDIASTLGAAVYGGAAPDVPFNEKRIAAKQMMEQAAAQGSEQMPVLSAVGTLSTALPVGLAIPQSAYTAPSFATRLAKGGAVGAALGGVYGAGQGIGEERLQNAIEQGAYGGVLGGIGATASDIIGAGWNGGRSLAKKAASILNRARQPQSNITVTAGQPTLSARIAPTVAPPSAELTKDVIPMSIGESTQNARAQALEYAALAGSFGDEAQRMAMEAKDIKNIAAKGAMNKLAGGELVPETGLSSATELKNAISQSYKAAKARTAAAYNKVGELSQGEQLQIAGDFVKNTVISSLDDFAKTGYNGRGFNLNLEGMKNAKTLYNQINKFKNIKNIKSVDFFRMEDWRGSVSQGISLAQKGSPEKAFLSGLLERYDTAMKQLPREAILNGDDAIIDAMEKARYARKSQGVLFERSKLVKDIVQNDDLTNEQFYNTISSLGAKSGIYVRDILRSASDDVAKQDALRAQLKQSILGSIVNKSLSAELKAGGTVEGGIEKMISFDKLETNLAKFINNKTLFNQVLKDPAEREFAKKLYNNVSLIKSTKAGSKNYSNTAYTMFNLLRSISPTAASANIFGIGVGKALEAAGKAGVENELAKSLAPVLKGVSDETTGVITNFGQKYGRQIMGAGLVSQKPIMKKEE